MSLPAPLPDRDMAPCYPVVIVKSDDPADPDPTWIASIPDIPGLSGFADSRTGALTALEHALAELADQYRASGTGLPPASTDATVMAVAGSTTSLEELRLATEIGVPDLARQAGIIPASIYRKRRRSSSTRIDFLRRWVTGLGATLKLYAVWPGTVVELEID